MVESGGVGVYTLMYGVEIFCRRHRLGIGMLIPEHTDIRIEAQRLGIWEKEGFGILI